MKLSNITHGPAALTWIVLALVAVLSILLISGHGIGLAIIVVLIFLMQILNDILPAGFAYIALAIIIVDCIVIILLSNTYCKK